MDSSPQNSHLKDCIFKIEFNSQNNHEFRFLDTNYDDFMGLDVTVLLQKVVDWFRYNGQLGFVTEQTSLVHLPPLLIFSPFVCHHIHGHSGFTAYDKFLTN